MTERVTCAEEAGAAGDTLDGVAAVDGIALDVLVAADFGVADVNAAAGIHLREGYTMIAPTADVRSQRVRRVLAEQAQRARARDAGLEQQRADGRAADARKLERAREHAIANEAKAGRR